jgi:hypothetical protein
MGVLSRILLLPETKKGSVEYDTAIAIAIVWLWCGVV